MAVKSFQASRQKISNGEFYEFVQAGGYFQAGLWSTEGW
jgi:formylglycine-generating enzyme required for sulfatase activity